MYDGAIVSIISLISSTRTGTMNTNVLMALSAIFMVAVGIVASFLPQEIMAYVAAEPASLAAALIVQLAGALYIGFGLLNWMARGTPIGGIYGRPISLGNFTHFLMVALAMWNAVPAVEIGPWVVIGAIIYTAFGLAFGIAIFTHPKQSATVR